MTQQLLVSLTQEVVWFDQKFYLNEHNKTTQAMKYRHISSLDLLLVIDSFVSSLIHPVFSSFTLYPFIFIPLFRSIAEKLFA